MTREQATTDQLQTSPEEFVFTCPRLDARGLAMVLVVVALIWIVIPRAASHRVVGSFAADYRTPQELSEDYWLAARHAEQSLSADQAILLGDSVIWGEYTTRSDTLSSHLNDLQSVRVFANRGVNGLHPLAISGFVRHYVRPHGKRVLLHANPLWLTSPNRDLSVDDGLSFNHPRLVPQFGGVPAYRASTKDRISASVECAIPLRQWARHLWIERMDGRDLPRWSLQNPDKFLPGPRIQHTEHQFTTQPWTKKGIRTQNYDWVNLAHSLQWKALRQTVIELREHDNNVFVLIGPFNAHLLDDAGRQALAARRDTMASWCESESVPYHLAETLPSELYADASHPLAAGYRALAEAMWNDNQFRTWAE